MLARIIEPTSKLDTLRVLDELGIDPPAYRTIFRRLPAYATDAWRQAAGARPARSMSGSARPPWCSTTSRTLYFETDQGDGFREPGFSKERRLEPQITIGLLTDARGFPLMVHAFEGNKAETKTMLPVIARVHGRAPAAATSPSSPTPGWCRRPTRRTIEDAGLSFILGARIPDIPYVGEDSGDASTPTSRSRTGRSSPSPGPPGPNRPARRDQVIYYQYRADRARRTLRGIDEQVAKAEKAVAGKTAGQAEPVRPADRRHQDGQPRPGGQGPGAGRAEGLRHQPAPHPTRTGVRDRRLPPAVADREELPDVQARPAGPADLPPQTRLDRSPPDHRVRRPRRQPAGSSTPPAGPSRRFVKTARRYRTITIQAGDQTITAADPIPDDAQSARPAPRRPAH